MNICIGICFRYRATKPNGFGRYEIGQKRCISCEQFLFWDGRHCPCCGSNLRTSPRKLRDKERLRLILGKQGVSNIGRRGLLQNNSTKKVHK